MEKTLVVSNYNWDLEWLKMTYDYGFSPENTVIYMRRVPVMKRTPFLEELYKDYQVLFVDDYSEVTEQLLLDNNQMFLDAQTQDLSKLDLNNFFETWKKP